MGNTLQLILAPSFGKGKRDSRCEDRYLRSPRVFLWDKQIYSSFLIVGVAVLGLWNLELPVPGLLLTFCVPRSLGQECSELQKVNI